MNQCWKLHMKGFWIVSLVYCSFWLLIDHNLFLFEDFTLNLYIHNLKYCTTCNAYDWLSPIQRLAKSVDRNFGWNLSSVKLISLQINILQGRVVAQTICHKTNYLQFIDCKICYINGRIDGCRELWVVGFVWCWICKLFGFLMWKDKRKSKCLK